MRCDWKTCFVALLALLPLSAYAVEDKPAAADADWTNLIEKGALEKTWTTKGNWKLDDEGVITLAPRAGESGWSRWDAYLWANKTYTNFEVEFEYKPQKGSNSGFYFRVADKNDPVAKGIEVQIYDSGSKKPGDKLTDHDSGGVIPGLPPSKNTAKPTGEWSKFHITVKEDKLTVDLNGEKVNEVDLKKAPYSSRPATGAIGFQDHALPLSLRNIKIRELK